MVAVTYNMEDYNAIKSIPIDYQLPSSVMDIINTLNTEFSAAQYQPDAPPHNGGGQRVVYDVNHFENRRANKFANHRKPAEAAWEREKTVEFVATKIVKKEGIEKKINDIRICLNKITNKNYEVHRDAIVTYMNEIVEEFSDSDSDDVNTDLHKIATTIFEIASTNKFYSEMYAILYKELMGKYPIFKDIVGTFFNTSYLECINAIKCVDQKENYDAFCLNNKENDKRKATTVFIVNLLKQGILGEDEIIRLATILLEKVVQQVDDPNKLPEVEEITENIFLLVPPTAPLLKSVDGWNSIVAKITAFSQYKVKEHVSLSSRVIFKYKDIVDALRK